MPLLTAIDIFAGAGGFSEGMKQAGINVVWANEINPDACLTYAYNHPNTILCQRDIRKVNPKEITKAVGEIGIVAGGPPCQGFSTIGRRRIDDQRNFLFKEFHRVVHSLKPSFFVMENVKGLLSFQQGNFLSSIKQEFEKLGYKTELNLLNAAFFGVPQFRERLFLIGSLDHSLDVKIVKNGGPLVSLESAISDLGFLLPGKESEEYRLKPKTEYQKKMRGNKKHLSNHKATRHNEKVISRFSMIKPGKDIKSLPQNQRTCKNIQFRTRAELPCRTLTTLPEDLIHYSLNRIFTVREMARVQSFHDGYPFLGPRTTGGQQRISSCPQYTQVGNAVPPLLSKGVFSFVRKQAT